LSILHRLTSYVKAFDIIRRALWKSQMIDPQKQKSHIAVGRGNTKSRKICGEKQRADQEGI
jgi:hypothetical protein